MRAAQTGDPGINPLELTHYTWDGRRSLCNVDLGGHLVSKVATWSSGEIREVDCPKCIQLQAIVERERNEEDEADYDEIDAAIEELLGDGDS